MVNWSMIGLLSAYGYPLSNSSSQPVLCVALTPMHCVYLGIEEMNDIFCKEKL